MSIVVILCRFLVSIDFNRPNKRFHCPSCWHFRCSPGDLVFFRVIEKEEPSHGYLVVEYMKQRGPLQDFEKLWRQRFVDSMKPRKLHELWRVDYDHLKMSV